MLRRFLLVVAAIGAVAAFTAPAALATTAAPMNYPDGSAQFVQLQALPWTYWYLNSSHQLINSQSISYFKAVYFPNTPWGGADELVVTSGPVTGSCLGQDGLNYDVRPSKAPCSASRAFDLWQFGSNNTYSEVSTVYGYGYGDCITYQGQGVQYIAFGCNGMSDLDHFEFLDEFVG